MKTSRILFIALCFYLLVFGKSYAQTFQLKTTEYLEIYAWCNGIPDLIAGEFDVHYIIKIKHGNVFHWAKTMQISGEAVSQSTDEVFRINHIIKEGPMLPGTKKQRSFHFNLVGENGTHIIIAITLELDQNWYTNITKLKAKCM